MAEHVFESVKALADELGISRTTLYKRAKDNYIELSGTYTEEQIDKLMGVHLKMDSEHKNEQSSEQVNEQSVDSAIKALSEQLTVKDDQIAELNRRLEQAHKLVDQSQQLQLKTQLQLEAEQQKVLALETELKQDDIIEETDQPEVEEKKSFWGRIFG
ncbi:hypothetical protein K1728_12125 (plasmid) [Weissella confusa]|uniref:hypothetical protein n=1 Tax=Weissella confusa TaxID=1583 RepID=UPI001C6FAD30|nr:hypothetical protein [Weissella confusa]QYU58984.1 hypothetical protein K1728_12125 [Weissella confusa]